jgi:HAE1 family hydrophobic/amphiphilic exporter-1
MARAVIGGLMASTLLTLFVVPVMYTILDDAGSWVVARLTGHAPQPAKTPRDTRGVPEVATGD